MDTKEALSIIQQAIEKIPILRESRLFSPEHTEFIQTTGLELARIFGPDSVIAKNFSQIRYQSTNPYFTTYFD